MSFRKFLNVLGKKHNVLKEKRPNWCSSVSYRDKPKNHILSVYPIKTYLAIKAKFLMGACHV